MVDARRLLIVGTAVAAVIVSPPGFASEQFTQRPAEQDSSTLAPDFRGRITYQGNYTGERPARRRNTRMRTLGDVVNALGGGPMEQFSGATRLEAEFDGSTVRITTHDGNNRGEFTGTRHGSTCQLVQSSDGAAGTFRCDRNGFSGELRSLSGARQQFRTTIQAHATQFVDAVDEERQQESSAQASSAAEQRRGIPEGFEQFTPSSRDAAAIQQTASSTITADSQSWLANDFQEGSVRNPVFYRASDDPANVFVRVSYVFKGFGGVDRGGWAALNLRNGVVECIQYHDRRSCTRPRVSRSEQIASLGGSQRRLGAMSVNSSCFRSETRSEQRSQQRVVYADRRGNVDTQTEYYSVPVEVTVFRCPSQAFELQCVAQGTDEITEWLTGSGTTRNHSIRLNSGEDTAFSAARISNYNDRIRTGTCVRTQ